MGFYNIQKGDMPYFTELARNYAISDNYHQPVMGGTGANHIMLGSADAYYYTDGHGHALMPPDNQIENPDPQPGTNNWYTQDGYSGGTIPAPVGDLAVRAQPSRHRADRNPLLGEGVGTLPRCSLCDRGKRCQTSPPPDGLRRSGYVQLQAAD